MAAAWKLPGARVVTLEAQPFSVALARKSVRYNGLSERFRLLEGDLRDPAALAGEAPFDLVLGAPPVLRAGDGDRGASPAGRPGADHAPRRDRRLRRRRAAEPRAGRALRLRLADGARAPRPDEALARERLVLLRRRDVVFREGEPPLVALFAASRAEDLPADLPRGREGFPVRRAAARREAAGRPAHDGVRRRPALDGLPAGRPRPPAARA